VSQSKTKQAGRVAARIAEDLKSRITSGELRIGQYLPGVREVGREHNVSPETARRAMKIMEAEHWVRCYPGHGFKVTAKGNDPAAAAPVAFILSGREDAGGWSPFGQQLLAAMYRAAESRGWSVLGIGATGRQVDDIVDELKAVRASGLLIDTPNEKLTRTLTQLGVPTVLVEELTAGLDSVTQDNFGGGYRAVQYLIERGHRRLAWLGGFQPTVQNRERWAGVQAAAREGGARMVGEEVLGTERLADPERLRRLLGGPEPPTGLLAFWRTGDSSIENLAHEVGGEVEVVGWCPRELLAEVRAGLPGGRLPATMVWSIRELGEAALARLAERRERPEASPVRVSVGVELMSAAQLWEEE
jgi:DNA-binding LacI/PurR family transcriptional regulator